MLNTNLLPRQEKEKIKLELNFNFLVEFTVLVIFLGLIFIGLLFSIYLYSSILTKAQLESAAVQRTTADEERFRRIADDIIKSNAIIENAAGVEGKLLIFSSVLEDLIAIFPRRIYLRNFSISSETKQIIINGYAPTREEMLNFKKILEGSQRFFDVYSPISNLLVPRNVNFTFTITLQ